MYAKLKARPVLRAQAIPGMAYVNETRVWTLEGGCNEQTIDALPPLGFVMGNKIFQLTSRQYIVAVRPITAPLPTPDCYHGPQLTHRVGNEHAHKTCSKQEGVACSASSPETNLQGWALYNEGGQSLQQSAMNLDRCGQPGSAGLM